MPPFFLLAVGRDLLIFTIAYRINARKQSVLAVWAPTLPKLRYAHPKSASCYVSDGSTSVGPGRSNARQLAPQ